MWNDKEIIAAFRSGLLTKVSGGCLYKFLKKYGVECRRKDKKPDLLVKTITFLTPKFEQH